LEDEEEIDDEDMYRSGPQRSGNLPELSDMNLNRSGPLQDRVDPNNDTRSAPATSMGECSLSISSLSRASVTVPAPNPNLKEHLLPIFDARNAKIKGYEDYGSRLATFDLWPVGKRPPKAELADCGFIYIADDMCQCFNCEVVLHEWQENDNVWKDHAKYSLNCDYVLFRKGEDFIASVRDEISARSYQDERLGRPPDERITGSEERTTGSQAPQHQVERRDVTARLDTDMARYVISMGFTEDEVGSVIQERMMEKGTDFENMTQMVNVLQEIQTKTRPPPAIQFRRRDANTSSGSTSSRATHSGPIGSRDAHQLPQSSIGTQRIRTNQEYEIGAREQTTVGAAVAQFAGPGPQVNSSGDLQEINEENEHLQDQELCSICVDRERNTVFIPCHHLISCHECANPVTNVPTG
jgi:hypothetical protein